MGVKGPAPTTGKGQNFTPTVEKQAGNSEAKAQKGVGQGVNERAESVDQEIGTTDKTAAVKEWTDAQSLSRMVEREFRAERKFQDSGAKASADIGQ